MARKTNALILKENEQIDDLKNYSYNKSNTLIQAKGKISVLGLKLFTLGLMNASRIEGKSGLMAVLYSKTIREMLDCSSGSLYARIKEEVDTTDKNNASILDWRIVYGHFF